MRRAVTLIAGLAFASTCFAPRLHAHEGPPFPIIVDKKAGPYVVSVWTDPDVGIGTFFVILTPPTGATLPSGTKVEVCVKPSSGRLTEACYQGSLQKLRNQVQYYAEVEFDRQEMWQVRMRVSGDEGVGEVNAEVEATPPGFGAWDLLIYGFPFILFGLLWLYAALYRWRSRPVEETNPAPPSDQPAGDLPA